MSQDLKSLIILFKAYNTLAQDAKLSLEASNLNINEFSVMEALHTKGQLTTQEIIDSVLIPNSSLTYVLDKLAGRGFIERSKDTTDRRIQYVSLTKAGTAIFETVYERHFKHMRAIFDLLTPEEEEQLQTYLKRIGKRDKA